MTRPTPNTLSVQLGRHWADRTTLGWTFCEPSGAAPSNLYACALPVRAHRLSPAASLTPTEVQATPPNLNLQAIGIAVEARARTEAGALAMLTDLHTLLWPNDGAFVHHATHHGQPVHGVIGIPAVGSGALALWRVVNLEPQTGPVVVPGGGTSGVRGVEGEAVASMTIGAACAPALIDWWE
jgi:hypothetical protein